MKNKRNFFFILILIASFHAHAQTTNYQSYAVLIHGLIKYSAWPNQQSEFKITVLGNSKAYSEMEKSLAGKNINGHTIRVDKAEDIAGIQGADIVYISEGKSNAIQEVVKATTNAAAIIITEREGLVRKGAGISFIIVDNKLRFDINNTDLEKRQIKVSAQFASLANETL
ncbi:MAG TPA: YfiR family protein [Ohtaekwangia sp.]|uniref:YfiR family protein n=1 Tax=Ohtaekwangia sp. TaxID=2066019 RepID=UPI002F9573DD